MLDGGRALCASPRYSCRCDAGDFVSAEGFDVRGFNKRKKMIGDFYVLLINLHLLFFCVFDSLPSRFVTWVLKHGFFGIRR